ncbi:hypothetical protein F5Y07DRAFT_2097 [Xylaria sp. FL0933]|nr:hypothetical protein F5Y07DRAFT_2097 [Xylaria sp. FL0933]
MSWRNQGITGSNNIPLGTRRRFGGDQDVDEVKREDSRDGFDGAFNGDRDLKRGRSPEPRTDADGPRRRKKRNRWGDASENKAAGLMGLPTAIVANMTSEQLEAYTLHLRIEEISQKLRIDDVVPADGDRSPSPPPQTTADRPRRKKKSTCRSTTTRKLTSLVYLLVLVAIL